jgi:hypothetical protein
MHDFFIFNFLLLIVLAFFELEPFESVQAVHCCTAGKPVKSYAEKLCLTEHRMTSFDRLCVFVLASSHGATEKQIRPPIFSPAGGNLFNASSVGLDRDLEGRSSQTRHA